jgi:low temperature requirement protein LtrA
MGVHRSGDAPAARVSTLELFFDLVFVFAITQLTATLHESGGVVQAVVLLGALLWVYDAYAWLTNAVPPRDPGLRILLLVAMAFFLLAALAIPHVFDGGGLGFGLAYLGLTVTHAGLFLHAGTALERRAMIQVLPRNLAIAGAVLVACVSTGRIGLIAWLLVVGLVLSAGAFDHDSGFALAAEHYVERMGLLVIVVLGESVVAVGAGAARGRLDATLALGAVGGLALCAALWWCYFAHDEEAAGEAFAALPATRRPRAAMLAFGYPFLLVLGGIVLVAAGLRTAVAEPLHALAAGEAWYLAAGVAAYLTGTALVRLVLRLPRWRVRLGSAAVAVVAAAVGTAGSALAELLALTAVVALLLVLEDRLGPLPLTRASGSPQR